MHTIAALLHTTFQAAPPAPALIDATQPARPIAAGRLDRHARAAATAIARIPSASANRPARIGILADNSPDAVIALLAALYAGATIAPLHASSPLPDLLALCHHLALDAIIADPPRRAIAAETRLPVFTTNDLANLGTLSDPGQPPANSPDAEGQPALLLTTSGTTGRPRAVVISQRSLLAHTRTLATSVLGLSPHDRVLATLPIAHSFGCRMALLAPLLAGATVVITPRFSASATIDILSSQRITWAPVVPTMLTAWLALPRPNLPALRWVLSAGAPLPDTLATNAAAHLGAPIHQGYGLTEASFCCIDTPPRAPSIGSVGPTVPGVNVRVIPATDLHAHNDRPLGDIEVRGDNLMDGYLDDPASTSEMLTSDGWLKTGDIGYLDVQGSLVITDRRKDIILSGGHTIHPAEVENALVAHPAVAAAAVVGIPDAFLGEIATAFIVLSDASSAAPDVASLSAFVATRLAAWKIPRAWRFVRALPVGPGGKVVRRALRPT